MATRANTYRSKASATEKKSEDKKGIWSGLNFNNDKLVKLIGLFLLLTGLLTVVAVVSYFFTWKNDQDIILNIQGTALGTPEQNPVQNWLGILGAKTAHLLMYSWFGISSLVLVYWVLLLGAKMLLKVTIQSLNSALGYGFFILIFLSVTMAFIAKGLTTLPHYLYGYSGMFVNNWLNGVMGFFGTGMLIFFVLLAFLVIAYDINLSYQNLKSIFSGNTPEAIPSEEEEEIAEEDEPHLNVVAAATKPEMEVPEEKEKEEEVEEEVEEFDENTEIPGLTVAKMKEESVSKSATLEEQGEYDPTLDLSSYKYPTLDLLEDHGSGKIKVSADELEANKNKIVETLGHYKIEISKIKATIGPTVTLYEIVPEAGVRISKIKNLEDDIALSLAALGIRIIAPIPGKGTIGIEVPNLKPETVGLRSVLATEKFQHSNMDLPIAFGRTISNEVFIADLAKMPHLLVAGATGQGKSVGINTVLLSLLYKKHPSQLKFVLVDPKKVELSIYKKIERHFLAKLPGEEESIITDTHKVVATLNSLCIEMDQRYNLLKDAHVRNLKEYNKKFVDRKLNPKEGHRYMPFIVLVIDEFADMMMTAGKEVETPIARLAQLARAVGIHLVIATQRPSVNIITGTIKANFPARLAFRVTSKIDSRTILDTGGADQLIGKGDMLLSFGSELIRIQCAFVDTPEVETVTDFVGNQRGYPDAYLLPEYVDESGSSGPGVVDLADRDVMFRDAAIVVVQNQQGSTSLIQRKLKIGYNRAGRIIDQLEAAGIVGGFEGSKARDVLIPDEYSLEQFLDTLEQDTSLN